MAGELVEVEVEVEVEEEVVCGRGRLPGEKS